MTAMRYSRLVGFVKRFYCFVILTMNLQEASFIKPDPRISAGNPQIDLIKTVDGRPIVVAGQRAVVGANAGDNLQAGRGRGIHFGHHIGQKNDICGTDLNLFSDSSIATRLPLGSDGGVKVLGKQWSQVTLGCMSEEEFLGEDTPGGIDLEIDPILLPSL